MGNVPATKHRHPGGTSKGRWTTVMEFIRGMLALRSSMPSWERAR